MKKTGFKIKFGELDKNFQMHYILVLAGCLAAFVAAIIIGLITKDMGVISFLLIGVAALTVYELRYVVLAMQDKLLIIDCVCVNTEIKEPVFSFRRQKTSKRITEFDYDGNKLMLNSGTSFDVKEGNRVRLFLEETSIIEQSEGVYNIINPVYFYKIG